MNEDCDSVELKANHPAEIHTLNNTECCDTSTVRQIPDELRNPLHTPPEISETVDLLTPKPIIISNHRQSVVCTEAGTSGDEVVVEDGTFTAKFYFSSVLSLTENVLQYIARTGQEAVVEKMIHDGTISDRTLRTLTGMTLVQARELIETVTTIQERQDSYAKESAEAKLYCQYWNNEQVATCDDTQMAQSDQDPEAVFRAMVPAGRYSSTESQEAADNLAFNAAKAMLVCFYLNDEVEVDCRTRPTRPTDNMEEVPNDIAPIYPGREKRVGKAKVPAGTYRSWDSKEDANDKALEFGYSLLVCWYPNEPVHIDCGNDTARSCGSDPSLPQVNADIDRKLVGQSVDIPYGYFTSEVSAAEATTEAEIMAESLLECCYPNNAMRLRCASEEVRLWTDATIVIDPEPDKGRFEVSVEAGQFYSMVSVEEADLFAQQSMEGLLECIYCNKRVMPVCVPDWITQGVLDGRISLPLQNVITDPVYGYSTRLVDLPPEATIGAAAKAYCDTSAQQAQDIAQAAAGAKAIGASGDCIYTNDAVFVCCAGVDPFTQEELEPGIPHYLVHPETGEPYIFYTLYPLNTCIAHDYSRPSSGGAYLTAPAGMFSAPGDSMKDYVNTEAIEFALSALTCVFTNPPTYGMCTVQDKMGSLCDGSWTLGKGLPDWGGQLVQWSNTAARPVYIARGYVMYVGAGNDEFAAESTIRGVMHSFGDSMIMCVYTNKQAVYTCDDLPEGPVRVEVEGNEDGPPGSNGSVTYTYYNNGALGTVGSETIFADTPTEADAIARSLAEAMAACDINTVTCMWWKPKLKPEPEPESSPIIPASSDPGPIPPPTPPQQESSSSSPAIPQPGPDDPCCYGECPQYASAQNPTAINLSEIHAVIQNVHEIIKRLDNKSNALVEHATTALENANG